jgi:hypothetical protein
LKKRLYVLEYSELERGSIVVERKYLIFSEYSGEKY